jgi:hypothetical protein
MKALLITTMLVMIAISGNARPTRSQTRSSGNSVSATYCATYQYAGPAEYNVGYIIANTNSGFRHQGSDSRLPMLHKGL